MKKKDKKFLIQLNSALLNQAMIGLGTAQRGADSNAAANENLEGTSYIEALQNAEHARTCDTDAECKKILLKVNKLERHFKHLKDSVKKPGERMVRMEERMKTLREDLKVYKNRNKKLEKRVDELEKCILFFIGQSKLNNCGSIADFNQQMKRLGRMRAYVDSPEIDMISGVRRLTEGGRSR